MGSAKEYLKKRKSRTDTADMNVDAKIKKRRSIKLTIALGVIITLALSALIVYIIMNNRTYNTYHVLSEHEFTGVSTLYALNYAGNILSYSHDGVVCLDTKGNILWNRTYEMTNPMVDIRGNYAAIADYNDHTIYLMNLSDTVVQINTEKPINGLWTSESGVTAALIYDTGSSWLYLYSSDGTKFAEIKATMEKSGYPLSANISSNGELLAVSYFYADAGKISTRMGCYNFGSVGQDSTDHMVMVYDYHDEVIPTTSFLNDSLFFALSDKRLIFYKGDQIPVSNADILLHEQIQSSFFGENRVALVFLDTDGDAKYRIDIYNDSGKVIHTQKFNTEYKDIILRKDGFIIYNESECTQYTMSGIEKFHADFERPISLLIPSKITGRYALMSDNSIINIEWG